jgi:hypothetical protein
MNVINISMFIVMWCMWTAIVLFSIMLWILRKVKFGLFGKIEIVAIYFTLFTVLIMAFKCYK